MNWHFNNDSPIYAQIVEQIKTAIVLGEFACGERLPSVRDMATEAGVNPNTMQRAMAELEREGLVCTQRTSGRLVTDDARLIADVKRALAQRHVDSFLAAMAELRMDYDEVINLLQRQGEGSDNESSKL